MYEDKILDSNFDAVEYGAGIYGQQQITINPLISARYEESTTDDIVSLYSRKRIEEDMQFLFETSPFYEKYYSEPLDDPDRLGIKKVERADLSDIYYYFKGKLQEKKSYNSVDIFCAIAEFFDLNYKLLYNDILTIADKADVLEVLAENYGLEKKFSKVNKLF